MAWCCFLCICLATISWSFQMAAAGAPLRPVLCHLHIHHHCSPPSPIYCLTFSFHLLLCLPRFLPPFLSLLYTFLTNLSLSIKSKCPDQCNIFLFISPVVSALHYTVFSFIWSFIPPSDSICTQVLYVCPQPWLLILKQHPCLATIELSKQYLTIM